MHTLGTKKSGNLPSNRQFVTQIIGREKKEKGGVGSCIRPRTEECTEKPFG